MIQWKYVSNKLNKMHCSKILGKKYFNIVSKLKAMVDYKIEELIVLL
jgi:hypothetical protein